MPQISLLDLYNASMNHNDMQSDPEQLNTIGNFQRLFDEIAGAKAPRNQWVFQSVFRRKSKFIRGIYIWGGVGRGKTYLMDLFFQSAPTSAKKRIHFHRFMQSIHHELKKRQNTRDPLAKIGRDFAKQHRLLCLDEFFVLDIADAVILAGLLKSLTDNGVVLVMTSNTNPDQLYQGGLQGDRFVPAIKLINSQMDVVHIGDGTDYRLRVMSGKSLYYDSLDASTTASLQEDLQLFSDGESMRKGSLDILDRQIQTVCHTNHLVWFEFFNICDGPRSKADYIEIANLYRTVIISNVPVLTWEYENQARRFIELVDEFYDRGVHLILSAETNINSIYTGTRLVREFERTKSRLHEMQTDRYLSRLHCG